MPQRRIEIPADELRKAYVEDGLSATECGRLFYASYRTVVLRLQELGIALRPPGRRPCGPCPTCGRRLPMRLSNEHRLYKRKRRVSMISAELLEQRKAGLA